MKRNVIRDGVLELMKSDERCRSDDKFLIWKFIREKAGIAIYIPFNDFGRMPSFESIRRIRAHIQNVEHVLLPTDENVRRRRRINEEEWRRWLSEAKQKYGVDK